MIGGRIFTSEGAESQLSPDAPEPSANTVGEVRSALSHQGAGRRERIWGRLDPVVATVACWADEDPPAMRRLLSDVELRAHLLTALDDLVPLLSERRTRRARWLS